jgi:hypothetical protein
MYEYIYEVSLVSANYFLNVLYDANVHGIKYSSYLRLQFLYLYVHMHERWGQFLNSVFT